MTWTAPRSSGPEENDNNGTEPTGRVIVIRRDVNEGRYLSLDPRWRKVEFLLCIRGISYKSAT